jgi:hypothetical protein
MAYYPRQLDLDGVMCDDCGERRWPIDPHYGTDIDARITEAQLTSVQWCWVPIYSTTASPCITCGTLTN